MCTESCSSPPFPVAKYGYCPSGKLRLVANMCVPLIWPERLVATGNKRNEMSHTFTGVQNNERCTKQIYKLTVKIMNDHSIIYHVAKNE